MPRPDAVELRALLGQDAVPCRRGISGEPGVALPAFTDHHVHLHLIDADALAAHGIAAVLDLGGDPVVLARREQSMPRVAYAGAFLTAPGGYPVGRVWAPAAAIREVRDPSAHPGVPGGARTAVDEQASFGASVIKVALNQAAGPVPDAATLATIVASAREQGLPIVAHAEGAGMVRLAVEAGVDALAHTPFTDAVDEDVIARAVQAGQRWITTLHIHCGSPAHEMAVANLARFAAAGGHVLYGTDLGNGDLAVGVNARELAAIDEAGIRGPDLVATLTDPWPFTERSSAVATFVPGDGPPDLDAVPAWLGNAVVVPAEELIPDDPR